LDAKEVESKKSKNMRYVIYSPTRGVYLGGDLWGTDESAKTRASAPTYEAGTDLTKVREEVPDADLRVVFPSAAGRNATPDDCANALLPRW
jgi:hypothetical protein